MERRAAGSWLLLEDERADIREDDDVDAGGFVDIPAFTSRLSTAVSPELRQPLAPDHIGHACRQCPRQGTTTHLPSFRTAATGIRALQSTTTRFLQARPPEDFASTALDAIFGGAGHTAGPPPILHPFPLGEPQLLAARQALAGPLTVVTGPPGTGKSQVIAAIMLSAAANGRSVLFAARQHRALDAVQERLEAASGDRAMLIRANQADSFQKFSFADAIGALQARGRDTDTTQPFDRLCDQLADVDARRWALLENWRDLRMETEKFAKIAHKIVTSERAVAADGMSDSPARPRPATGLWAWLWVSLRRLLSLPQCDIPFGRKWQALTSRRNLERLRRELSSTEGRISELRTALDRDGENPVALTEQIGERRS